MKAQKERIFMVGGRLEFVRNGRRTKNLISSREPASKTFFGISPRKSAVRKAAAHAAAADLRQSVSGKTERRNFWNARFFRARPVDRPFRVSVSNDHDTAQRPPAWVRAV
jgi:hypothetical protein